MNVKILMIGCALCASLAPSLADARGFAGGGGGGFRGGGGGFDMHGEAPAAHSPGSYSHSSTGPAGTNRTTNVNGAPGDYNRTTTSTNGNYNHTGTGSMNNGTYSHNGTSNSAYGTHNSNGSYNTQNGNYNRSASGSNGYGSYNTNSSGNAYNHTGSTYTSGSNIYGQTYSSATYHNNGYVYHGATVNNPVYYGYPAWGWNAGYAWDPVPYYYGGGFWGPFALGAATAVAFGTFTTPTNQTITSYEVQPSTPGSKLLQSYHLTQTPCGPPNLVVIFGPDNSAICAKPNNLVAAGTYGVNEQTLTLTSVAPKSS
ncbi:MAG: hypothetical protein JO322_05140 [Candidatus Eremiobacteraeota bacterium]|nr:hypothetical protein [Candidatus Eremiobacteraeota bacterium]